MNNASFHFKQRVNEIDLLRFIAAISVVFFHYTFMYKGINKSYPYPFLRVFFEYGYLGVQLFFMVSGFVIFMTASSGGVKNFIASRVSRLYPAFWICCSLTFVARVIFGDHEISPFQYLVNMTMLSGFVHVPSMDAVYWTLFVEMRFYFLFLIVLLFKQIHRAQHLLVFWLLVSVLSEMLKIDILRQIFLSNNSHSAYFIAGATYYLIWTRGLSIRNVTLLIVSWLWGIFGVVSSASEFSNSYNVSHSPIIVFLIITLFFVVFWLVVTSRTGFLGVKQWSLLGTITYPLYLIHESIGWIVLDVTLPIGYPWISLFLTILSMLIIAYIVHVHVERRLSIPVRNFTFTILNLAYKRSE